MRQRHFRLASTPSIAGFALATVTVLVGLQTLPSFAGPAAWLDVGKALDPNLVRIDGSYLAVGHTEDVSFDPTSTTVVRKIGYGRTSFVTIATTPTGVYSTDGLASVHVRYPGVFTAPVRLAAFGGTIMAWSRLTGWETLPLVDAHSFGVLDTYLPKRSRDEVCVTGDQASGCR